MNTTNAHMIGEKDLQMAEIKNLALKKEGMLSLVQSVI